MPTWVRDDARNHTLLRTCALTALCLSASTGCYSEKPVTGSGTEMTGGGGSQDSTDNSTGTTSMDQTTSTTHSDATSTSGTSEASTTGEVSSDESTQDSGTESTDSDAETTDESTTGDLETSHILFVTAEIYEGNLGGLAGADSTCTLAAQLAELPGERWVAVLASEDAHLETRITIDGPIYNTRDEMLTADAAEFWESKLRAELYDQDKNRPSTWDEENEWAIVWAPTPIANCDGWTDHTSYYVGYTNVTIDGKWSSRKGQKDWGCGFVDMPFMCISQPALP